jgi:hypothetical protein
MGDVWFYKTQAEIEDETGLTRYEQEGARKKLVASGVLEEQKKGIPAKLYFRVNPVALASILLPDFQRDPRIQGCGKTTSSDAEKPHPGMGKTHEPVRGNSASIHTVDYTETTTEITTEIKKPLGASADAAPPTGVSGSDKSPGKTTSKKPASRQEYSPEFEQAWQEYPKRAGGNPKTTAYKHWKARIADGTAPADLLAGVRRYAAYIRATGKLGTEYVKQAATFFGSDRHFEEPWTPPAAPNAPGGARGMPNSGFRDQDYGRSRTNFLLQGDKS